MFSFYWPWAALLFPIPLLVWKFWPRRHKASDYYSQEEGATLLHPALGRLASTFLSARSLTHTGSRQKTLLLALLWLSLILALMRPEWLEPYSEVRTEGYDLMLAVDASRSMDALDFTVNGRQVTRMAVVKGVIGRFIQAREGDRIGMIVFGSQAFVLSPLTLDI
jgi:Ca-activated chloride channel family protein